MKKIFAIVLSIIMLAGAAVAVFSADDASPFKDVKTSRWSYEAIKYAVEKGYMNGVGDGKFDPAGNVTRGMAVTVLYRKEGSPETEWRADFTDVKSGKYYSKAVIWAKDNGIVNGVTDTTFDPNGYLTREQLAAIFYRYGQYGKVDVSGRADLSVFPDAGKAHKYAKDALACVVDYGLISGVKSGDKTLLDPLGTATREQFATILMRLDETEFKYIVEYNEPQLISQYTEKEYPLVTGADVYVAVDGNDTADGSFEHPMATWSRAAERVREIKAERTSGDIIVAFKAGDYGPLSVNLTAEDAGGPDQRIIYCKYGDGDVTFNNGYDIPKEDFAPVSEEEKTMFRANAADKIYVADVTGKLGSYDPAGIMLSDNGVMTLARFPNKYADGTDNLVLLGATTTGVTTMELTHPQLISRIRGYHTLDGLKIYGFLTFGWYKEMLTVGSYDEETHEMFISDYYKARSAEWTGGLRWEQNEDGTWTIKDDVDMCFCNVSEELDLAGEFWIDVANQKMYVYGEPDNYHILGGSGRMITVDGGFVSFIGLDFLNSSSEMLYASGDGVTLEYCEFAGCNGEYGARISIPENANASGMAVGTTVRGCEFRNCASNGLYIEGCRKGLNKYRGQANVLVDNCFFTECNLVESNTGALRFLTSGATATHNYIYSTCWEGIDYRGTSFLTAKYNVFERVCYNGDDTGAVNAFDDVDTICNLISNNLFLSCNGGKVGRYCAYLDNSTGTEFCSNIIYDCSAAVMCNGNRDNSVHDNVVIDFSDSFAGITVKDDNTVATTEAGSTGDFSKILAHDTYKHWKTFVDKLASDELLWALIAEKAPHLLNYTVDPADWESPNFVFNIVSTVTGNIFFNQKGLYPEYSDALKQFGTYENNVGYTLEDNPIFVNPALGDYRIREDVTDFPDIEFEKIGRY